MGIICYNNTVFERRWLKWKLNTELLPAMILPRTKRRSFLRPGKSWLTALQSGKNYDILLLDVMMDELDGMELA